MPTLFIQVVFLESSSRDFRPDQFVKCLSVAVCYRGAQEISQKVSDVRKHPGASLTTAKVMLMQVHRKLPTQSFGTFKVGLRRMFVLVQPSLSNQEMHAWYLQLICYL